MFRRSGIVCARDNDVMKRLGRIPAGLLFGAISLAPLGVSAGNALTNHELARQLNEAFVDVAEKVSPVVVVVDVVQKPEAAASSDDEEESPFDKLPDFWRDFHKQFREQSPERSRGEGSGVIIRSDGYILTNGHVVENAESIEVRLRDGRRFKATVRGVDHQSDVAVLKIEADSLPAAVMADSSKARVGEFAIAIGAPFSLDYSFTFGHVSAKGRSNVLEGPEGLSMDQDFIQTDANINPGNSGGPLVNIDGEVIGINTLIRGLRTGIGFAIPSNLAREISDRLIADGKFARPWLGVGIRSLREDPDFRELLQGVSDGVVVQTIMPGGPASKADLKPSDIITAIDGHPVSTPQQLRSEIREKAIGQTVALDVFRPANNGSGKRMKVNLQPEEWVEPVVNNIAISKPAAAEQAKPVALGVTVRALTSELINQFGVEMTSGVIVTSVDKNTLAERKGIRPGDIITAINQQPVESPAQFREALAKADLKKGIIVNLVSAQTARFEILKEGEAEPRSE